MAALFVQFAVARFISEPYPALLFPAFAEAPASEATFNYQTPLMSAYSNGEPNAALSAQRLFDTVPPVHAAILARRIFNEKSFLFRDFRPTPEQIERSKIEGAKNYIRTNIQENHDLTQIDSLRVQWVDVKVDLNSDRRDTTRLNSFTLVF